MPQLFLLRALTLLTAFAAALIGTYYVASLEALPPARKGTRGLARVRALRKYSVFRMGDSLLRWAASRVHGFVPELTLRNMDRTLSRAGDPLGLEPTELVAGCALSALFGMAFGGTYAWLGERSPMYGVLCLVLGGVYPWVRVDGLQHERGQVVSRSLPGAVDLFCLSLSAGLDFVAAVRQVVEKTGQKDAALIQEFSIVLHELSLGKTRREALAAFSERNPGPSVREFVSATIQGDEEGQPLGDVLRIQATVSRERRTVFAEEASSRAGLQLLIPMGLLLVSCMGLIGGPIFLRLADSFGDA